MTSRRTTSPAALRRSVRQTDEVFRIGGEEFMPDASVNDAHGVMTRAFAGRSSGGA